MTTRKSVAGNSVTRASAGNLSTAILSTGRSRKWCLQETTQQPKQQQEDPGLFSATEAETEAEAEAASIQVAEPPQVLTRRESKRKRSLFIKLATLASGATFLLY
jgi:hypothetical protein